MVPWDLDDDSLTLGSTAMKRESTYDEDPHHHSHGARGLVVGPPTVHRETLGSIPAAHLTNRKERFIEPETQSRFGLRIAYSPVAEIVQARD